MSEKAIHPLLKRQLRKYLQGNTDDPQLDKLLTAISESYYHSDSDRALLERAMDISSEELFASNLQLREQAEQNQQVLDALREAFTSLQEDTTAEQNSLQGHNPNDLLGIAELFKSEVVLRKRAERGLLESESHLSSVIENTNDGILSFDKELRLKTANSRAKLFFSMVYSQTIPKFGTTLEKLLPSDAYGYWKPMLDDALRGKSNRFEQSLCYEGRNIYLDTILYPVFSHKNIIGVSVFTKDITERKEIELRQTQLVDRLEVANRELRDFAYVTSHDLKSPLRAIGSLVNWLGADYRHLFDEEGKDKLRLLESRVHRMYNFIDGMLNYARLGHANEAFQPTDLHQLITHLIGHSFASEVHKGIKIEGQLPTLMCQPLKVEQLFLNLLSNAVKYSNADSLKVTIRHQQLDNHWQFSVSDNGIGISKEHFDRIFKIFQTLEVRDQTESTGIGLSIVKKIVELHKGKVWVESVANQGSTFYFTISAHLGKDENAETNSIELSGAPA
ncbi:MAG: ATP-binding protein [Salibacteraceae bacterium]